ncbi:unnamed protein product [Scytosiphon promiscuus]
MTRVTSATTRCSSSDKSGQGSQGEAFTAPPSMTPEGFQAGGGESQSRTQQPLAFIGGGGSDPAPRSNGANFIFQTRAGIRRVEPGLRPGRSLGMPAATPLVMSGSDGLVVGAEGVFPVEIGFTEGKSEGAGDERTMNQKRGASHHESAATAEELTLEIPFSGASWKTLGRQKLDEVNSSSSIGEQEDSERREEPNAEVSGLESWAADFGLLLSEDGKVLEGSGASDGGGVESNPLAGWGEFEENVVMTPQEEGKRNVGGFEAQNVVVRPTDVAATGAGPTSAGAATAQVGKHMEDDHESSAKEGCDNEARSRLERSSEYPRKGGQPRPAVEASVKETAGVDVDGDTGHGADSAVSRFRDQKKPLRPNFFSGLRSLGGDRGDRDAAKLEAAARVAGGELYGIADRLSTLSSMLAEGHLSASGKEAENVAEAANELESLRTLLKTGKYRNCWGTPGEVRRAVKSAERLVKDAERSVQKKLKSVDDAGARQAAALSEISACRDDLGTARARLRGTDAVDSKALPMLLEALGKVQASVDVCADRLGQSSTAPSQNARPDNKRVDEKVLATCKADVEAVVADVDDACAKWKHEQEHLASRKRKEASWYTGDRWLVQARAMRRAILGPEGAGRPRTTALQEAIERLDAALAEADRLRADVALRSAEEQDGGEAFAIAAREASRAAEKLQKAGEAEVNDSRTRAEGARTLVSMALGEVAEMEAGAKSSGLASDRSVAEALRVARKGLERVSGALEVKTETDATRREKNRFESLIASGRLESALKNVDAARVVASRARRVECTETEARDIVSKEGVRLDGLSLRAQALGLLKRPAVARALQAGRAAATTAKRFDSRGRHVSLEKREALAQEHMAAAANVCEATGRAEETIKLAKDIAAINEEERCRAVDRLESSNAVVALLQGRVDHLALSAEQHRAFLEGTRVLTLSWKVGTVQHELRRPTPADLHVKPAEQATAGARKILADLVKKVDSSDDVAALDDELKSGEQRVSFAEAAVAQAEIRGRRRGDAIAILEGAAANMDAVLAEAQAAKVVDRPAAAGFLSASVGSVRRALFEASGYTGRSGPGEVKGDDPVLSAARQAEQAVEAAAESVAKERVLVEQVEEERQDTCAELWSAARRLEGVSTSEVVGDDPEAAAMILEARSEMLQALQALEAAEDPSDLLTSARSTVANACTAEENFIESQRRARCFDDATRLLEQAELLVEEAQTTMKATVSPTASRTAFQEALGRYENVLSVAAASSDGADAFLETCTAAFHAAREVDRAAVKASRRVRAHKERLRRELARLDRPAAALAALDLSELSEAREQVSFRDVAEDVRDAQSVITSMREEVARGSQDQGEAEEAALAGRVEAAVQAAASAERSFREAREGVRRMNRGWQQLARPEASLTRTRKGTDGHLHADIVSELCAVSMQCAEDSLAMARRGVMAVGKSRAAIDEMEVAIEKARVQVRRAQRDADDKASILPNPISAAAQRQMLRSALVTSSDSIVQAQAGLEAERQGRSPGDAVLREGSNKLDPMSEALRACDLAERAVTVARERLERPLTAEWFRAVPGSRAGEEERAVQEAQVAAADAEQAAARLVERLGQVRGIRAKLRSLLGHSEARFRRATAALADVGLPDVDEAVHVAGGALAVARDRLRSPLGSGYLAPDGGVAGGGDNGSLAYDEEAVSEAAGFVEALELLASREVSTSPAVQRRVSPPGEGWGEPQEEPLNALALALQWNDALRAQVAQLKLESDPVVARAMEATARTALVAENLWSSREKTENGGSNVEARIAVKRLAERLEELEKLVENAAENRRLHQAGLGVAAGRLDRLTATLSSLQDSVESADEPLLVSLTASALKAAHDAIATASAAAGVAQKRSGGSKKISSKQNSTFADAVQAAAVAVAQAEATVSRARERAPEVSAERVRALQSLLGLAETLSEAGEQLASSFVKRGLPSSREAAAAILEAQAGLSKARAAAKMDGGTPASGAAAISEIVAEARELVRRAKRATDGPADDPTVNRSTSSNEPGASGAGEATDDGAVAAVKSRAWSGAEREMKGKAAASKQPGKPSSSVGDVRGKSAAKGQSDTRKARIGFSKKGAGSQDNYLPLWMRLQKKLWDAGGPEKVEREENGLSEVVAPGDKTIRYSGVHCGTSTGVLLPVLTPPDGMRETPSEEAAAKDWRRSEEKRLRAKADRLKAEVARLRALRDYTNSSTKGVKAGESGGLKEARSSKQAAEALAEEMVKDFATRAKKEAQQRGSRIERPPE